MRIKFLKIVVVLLLSGSGDARPQRTEESIRPVQEWRPRSPIIPRNIQEDSSVNGSRRHLKDLQNIDQSLRTVATQLLNVTSPEEPAKILDNTIKKPNIVQKSAEKNNGSPIEEIPASNVQSMSIGFSRPINSKFSYFETSHPGQAMAITEEELEKEMSSTRLMTAYKNHPTTTGGISTWILLNPPSTTVKSTEVEKKTKQPSENEVRVAEKPTTVMERVETTERVTEKSTIPVSSTIAVEEASTTKKSVPVTTKKPEAKPEKIHSPQKEEVLRNVTLKVPQTTVSSLESKEAVTSTTKKTQHVRTTPKPKIATTKTTVLSKPSGPKTPRPNQQARPKPPARRTTTVKPEIVKNDNSSTGKIEKVTFRPIQMITIPKTKVDSTEKPMFVTKIKASILMDTQKTTSAPSTSSTTSLDLTTTSKTGAPSVELVEVTVKPKPGGTKVNNVLKVQLKKPVEETTKIEIEPVKTNAPVMKTEKVDKKEEVKQETESLDATRIDSMKFDFNPELTKINANSESTFSTTTTPATTTSTTKRPRNSSKRKKNKVRRRKPSTPATSTTTVSPVTSVSTEMELTIEDTVAENGIQESKIAPETKVATNSTKTKKKPASPPFSMQIYNFLSREVMPSFGVMSLVGLGLGLASYFLYPFGGTIARRNYEVEPKYKYNFEEYGGSYGQSEEEVLAKVLQGMTPEDGKYPGKDYDNNYYKYQQYDGGYEPQTTKKSSPVYRPENTASILKYRNTDYRYPDPPSTPIYYDRPKPSEYAVGQTVPDPANRQFVVGSVPKEYPPYNENPPGLPTSGQLANSYEPTESSQAMFEHELGQNFNFPVKPVQNYGQIQTARPEETYEEVEITPTAVAVEHGPRSLKTKRSPSTLRDIFSMARSRRKRDSVIQVIPSKRELEEEEKEEDLSNEILNIIDAALPEKGNDQTSKKKDTERPEDFVAQRKRQKHEETTRLKESTTKSQSLETSSTMNTDTSTVSSTIKEDTEPSTSSTTNTELDNASTSPKTTEQSNIESIDITTKKPAEQNGFALFNFVKKIAEIKFRLGLTLLKHASESFARYLGHVQKRINGEE